MLARSLPRNEAVVCNGSPVKEILFINLRVEHTFHLVKDGMYFVFIVLKLTVEVVLTIFCSKRVSTRLLGFRCDFGLVRATYVKLALLLRNYAVQLADSLWRYTN